MDCYSRFTLIYNYQFNSSILLPGHVFFYIQTLLLKNCELREKVTVLTVLVFSLNINLSAQMPQRRQLKQYVLQVECRNHQDQNTGRDKKLYNLQ